MMLSFGGNSEVNRSDRNDGQDTTLDMRQYLRRLATPLSAHHTVARCDGLGDSVCVKPEQRQVKPTVSNASCDAPMPYL